MKILSKLKENLHRCRYKVIGTSSNTYSISADLVCNKCEKVITVNVSKEKEDDVYDIASKHKYFNIPKKYIIDAREFRFDRF